MKEDLFEQLETERLLLRKIESKDAKELYCNIYNNFDWYQYYYQLPFENFEEYQKLVNQYDEWYRNGNHFRWGIVKKDSNEMIGLVQLHTKDNLNHNCKLGYIISYKENRKGYMKEALKKVIDFAFYTLGYHRIEAEIVMENKDSIYLVESLGMMEEKIRHESYLLNGKYYNQIIYTIINRKKENEMEELTMEKLVNYCKQYGFIFQGSEIYGGLANTWDYGPLGSRLKNNIKDTWRKRFIQERERAYEVDAAILMHPKVWEASGHVSSFSDPLIDCKECRMRHRADNLIDDYDEEANADGMTQDEMIEYIRKNKVPCPNCGKSNYTDIRQFNLMFETHRGVTEDGKNKVYLRPENAQGEYVNFLNVQRTMRAKLPFSIGQIGKAFRNEITPGNFTFRTIEFEQMEYQTFCKEGTDSDIYNYFKDYAKKYLMDLGIAEEKLRYHDHEKLAHYAKEACDIEYKFSFGWGEINGTHNRTNYDLSRHQEFSNVSQEYLDPITNEKYIPYIIESTIGADRLTLAVLDNAYCEEQIGENDIREVMKFHPALAPYKACVLPLLKKYHSEKANEIYQELSKYFMTSYDETGSIGKRYRRSDAIGTPFCITIDDETVNNNTVTIRDRDTMEQITLKLEEVVTYINDKVKF